MKDEVTMSGLSNRTRLALARNKILSLPQLWQVPLRDLAAMPGIGRQALSEIRAERVWRIAAGLY